MMLSYPSTLISLQFTLDLQKFSSSNKDNRHLADNDFTAFLLTLNLNVPVEPEDSHEKDLTVTEDFLASVERNDSE